MARALIFAALATLVSGCPRIAKVPIDSTGGVYCVWHESEHSELVLFSGSITFEGEGLDAFEEYLTGSWSACGDGKVECRISIEGPE